MGCAWSPRRRQALSQHRQSLGASGEAAWAVIFVEGRGDVLQQVVDVHAHNESEGVPTEEGICETGSEGSIGPHPRNGRDRRAACGELVFGGNWRYTSNFDEGDFRVAGLPFPNVEGLLCSACSNLVEDVAEDVPSKSGTCAESEENVFQDEAEFLSSSNARALGLGVIVSCGAVFPYF